MMETQRRDRVGELLEGIKRKRRVLVSPEGVELDTLIANHGERLSAFIIDMFFMFVAVVILCLLLMLVFFSRTHIAVGMTLVLFVTFIVRNCYFLHFELAWQGRTPGKKMCGLRVINREGGELLPLAIIARNLTREIEVFLPLSLFMSMDARGGWAPLVLLGWVLVIVSLPFFNRYHLRAGDLIGGTMVISMPKRVLLTDLTEQPQRKEETVAYTFTHEQLEIYGAFELQVLEEFLRKPPSGQTDQLLGDVCLKICRKIGWDEVISPQNTRRFLSDFYAAERANLERGQLFSRLRADKTSAPTNKEER